MPTRRSPLTAEAVRAHTVAVAPEFETFVYRYWIENELWELGNDLPENLDEDEPKTCSTTSGRPRGLRAALPPGRHGRRAGLLGSQAAARTRNRSRPRRTWVMP